MADPIPPLAVVLGITAVVAGVDALVRARGLYAGSDEEWPAGYRVRCASAETDVPYRATAPWHEVPVVAAGIPATVSVPTFFVVLLAVLWSFAFVMGFGDLPAAFAGRRVMAFTCVSIVWCGLRTVAACTLVGAAVFRQPQRFVRAAASVAVMDAALMVLPVPCSDIRADDISMARAGLVTVAALALGFAIAQWRRRGTLTHNVLRAMH